MLSSDAILGTKSNTYKKTIMSTAFRPKRSIPSAVNTPTAVRIKTSQTINKEEAEAILTDFISVSETIVGSLPNSLESGDVTSSNTGLSNGTGSSAILSQLKRVQRDLRGLPPLLSEVSSAPASISATEGQNKKIKFDADGADVSIEPKNKKIKFDDNESDDVDMTKSVVENEEEDKLDEEEGDEVEDDEEEEEEREHKEQEKSKKEKHEKKEKKEKKHKKEKKEKKDKKKDHKA